MITKDNLKDAYSAYLKKAEPIKIEFEKIGIAMWVNIAICIAAIIYYESLIR